MQFLNKTTRLVCVREHVELPQSAGLGPQRVTVTALEDLVKPVVPNPSPLSSPGPAPVAVAGSGGSHGMSVRAWHRTVL